MVSPQVSAALKTPPAAIITQGEYTDSKIWHGRIVQAYANLGPFNVYVHRHLQ